MNTEICFRVPGVLKKIGMKFPGGGGVRVAHDGGTKLRSEGWGGLSKISVT